jgi:zinc transport system permease protein
VVKLLDLMLELFSYAFVRRAIVVGIMVSLCASLLGVSLVLKRYSMIGDGLSHVGFGTLTLSVALGLAPLQVSLPLVMLTAFLLLRLSESGMIKGDAAIALVSSSSLAIGVIIISFSTGMNADVYNFMFGTILAMTAGDVYISIAVASVVLVLYLAFYNRIFAVTFDEHFACAIGIRSRAYNTLLALLTAAVIVIGMRMMGAMLISSLIIFPALTSMRVLKSFRSVTAVSALLSVVCFFVGIVVSFVFSTPTGASVVVVNLAAFCLFSFIGYMLKIRGDSLYVKQ